MPQPTNVKSRRAEGTGQSARANYCTVFPRRRSSTRPFPTQVHAGAGLTVRSAAPGTQVYSREPPVAEVAFHKRRFLEDARMTGQHAFEYMEFLADFSGDFHYFRSEER